MKLWPEAGGGRRLVERETFNEESSYGERDQGWGKGQEEEEGAVDVRSGYVLLEGQTR